MTNPTRQEIIDAHEALEKLKDRALYAADFFGPVDACLLWKSEILKALPPIPQPTMAEVEWDDDVHFLAGATTPIGREAVMLWHDDEDTGNIITTTGEWRRDQLTPTGRKYELKEKSND